MFSLTVPGNIRENGTCFPNSFLRSTFLYKYPYQQNEKLYGYLSQPISLLKGKLKAQ